jgi:hypothetical protein
MQQPKTLLENPDSDCGPTRTRSNLKISGTEVRALFASIVQIIGLPVALNTKDLSG